VQVLEHGLVRPHFGVVGAQAREQRVLLQRLDEEEHRDPGIDAPGVVRGELEGRVRVAAAVRRHQDPPEGDGHARVHGAADDHDLARARAHDPRDQRVVHGVPVLRGPEEEEIVPHARLFEDRIPDASPGGQPAGEEQSPGRLRRRLDLREVLVDVHPGRPPPEGEPFPHRPALRVHMKRRGAVAFLPAQDGREVAGEHGVRSARGRDEDLEGRGGEEGLLRRRQPEALLRRHRDPVMDGLHQDRGQEGGDDRHQDEAREELDVEDAQVEADLRHDQPDGPPGAHEEPERQRRPGVQPAEDPAQEAADHLPADRDEDDRGGEPEALQLREIDPEPHLSEEEGGEQRHGDVFQLVEPLGAQRRDLAHQDARHEGPEDRMDVHRLRGRPQEESDPHDDHQLAAGHPHVVVGPRQPRLQPRVKEVARREHEGGNPGQRDRQVGDLEGAGGHHAGDHRQDDPAEGVVHDGGTQRKDAHVAPDHVQVHEDLGDHRHGGKAHHRGDEVRQGKAPSQHEGVGKGPPEQQAGDEGDDDPEDRGQQGRPPHVPHGPDVGLEAGEQHQEHQPHEGDGLEVLGLDEDRPLQVGKEQPQERRPQQDPGQQLPQHGGLVEPLEELAQSARQDEDEGELDEEGDFRAQQALRPGGMGGRFLFLFRPCSRTGSASGRRTRSSVSRIPHRCAGSPPAGCPCTWRSRFRRRSIRLRRSG
jgi:hypothetical protein